MTTHEFKRPALRSRGHHLVKQFFSGWPWIIWLTAAVMVLLLLPGGLNRIRFYGEAERTYEYVAPLEDGRLKALSVDMGETVEVGQLLGELDNASLAVEGLMDQASLMKTRDKIYSIGYEVESLKLEEAKAAAELQAMESRWTRTKALLAKNLILEQEVEDLRPQIEATQKVLARYPALIAQLEKRLEAAQRDVEMYDSDELKALQQARGRLVATTSGVVAELLHLPGDVVETGDPILRISNVSTLRIIAFIPEENRSDIAEGDPCKVITTTTRQAYMGKVKTITADIRKLPVFTGFSDEILRGRRIVIELENGATLTPGERVVVVPDVSIFDQWFGKKK
jgi:multidrug resistance efflux pump